MKMRLIGDIHGDMNRYNEIIKDSQYSIQVGDMGYEYTNLILSVDSKQHKFIPGNHCNYDEVFNLPHLVRSGDNPNYGMSELNGFKFFFVRGGYSLDWEIRDYSYKTGKWPQSYFPEEELSYQDCYRCFEEYIKAKPDILISHECPRTIARMVGNDNILQNFGHDPKTFTTRTSELLQAMVEAHPPRFHYFGHYHRDWAYDDGKTFYKCIADQAYIDVEY